MSRIVQVAFVIGGALCLGPRPTCADEGASIVPREFRGVWIATVDNLDWPSRPGLSSEAQQHELIEIFDRVADLNFNAVVLQVRPCGDAFYASKLEPWSTYLTGQQGKPPTPFYDPLAFAVREAHARGLELHAWINPYRAQFRGAKGGQAESHLSQTHPELVKSYGRYLWMDPGEPEVRAHSLAVVKDIVSRYDVDGIHMDDYFYPYKEVDKKNQEIPFPDDESYARYRAAGGDLKRDDWRRANVDAFVRELYDEVKEARPTVQVGISPFGIWRPGHPPQIRGFDAYQELYADSRKWLREGWCDYFTPQLYWPVGQTEQDYTVLQAWWVEQNTQRRHIWPGMSSRRALKVWKPVEIAKQLVATRECDGATGTIQFSAKALMEGSPELIQVFRSHYDSPAVPPASDWLDASVPTPPKEKTVSAGTVEWLAQDDISRWLVRAQSKNGNWSTRVLPGAITRYEVESNTTLLEIRGISRSNVIGEVLAVSREGLAE